MRPSGGHLTCTNGVPGPVALPPARVALLASGGGFVVGGARVERQLHFSAHVVDVDHAGILA